MRQVGYLNCLLDGYARHFDKKTIPRDGAKEIRTLLASVQILERFNCNPVLLKKTSNRRFSHCGFVVVVAELVEIAKMPVCERGEPRTMLAFEGIKKVICFELGRIARSN